jgi:hypothetical protein
MPRRYGVAAVLTKPIIEMSEQKFPPGWDAERIKKLIAHYGSPDDESLVAEDEAAK